MPYKRGYHPIAINEESVESMYINPPEKLSSGSWAVELVNYPESRSTEAYTFDTKTEAVAFWEANKNYGKEQPSNNRTEKSE